MKIKYIGPHDAVEIVGHPGVVASGEEFDVAPDLGASLLEQAVNYEPADDESRALVKERDDAAEAERKAVEDEEARVHVDLVLTAHGLSTETTVADLKQHAIDHGIELDGATNKPDLIAAIVSHYTEGA